MKPDDYEFMARFLKERSGLVLSRDKTYLLENRLMPVARKRMMNSLDELFATLRAQNDEELIRDVTEAMTTNESFFFRDLTPFTQFQDIVLPRFIEARASRKSLRIWCAAASTGQEPYTIAMIVNEAREKIPDWRIEIVATDLSTAALQRAKDGRYTQFEVQRGLPVEYLVKYFRQEENHWQIDDSIRSMVSYRIFNLLDDVSTMGPVDIIFCRNVLIYFDAPTKGVVLDGMSELLPDDGVLYLGGAETVLGVSKKLKPVADLRGVYRRVNAAQADAGNGVSIAPVPPQPAEKRVAAQ